MYILFMLLFGIKAAIAQPPEVEWNRYFLPSNDNFSRCTSAAQLTDGSFAIAGRSFPINGPVIHVSANGDSLWSIRYDVWITKILALSDGGLAIASIDFHVRRTNQSGQVLWTYQPTVFPRPENCYDMVQTTDGGFAMVGSPPFDDMNILLMKCNSQGEEEWWTRVDSAANYDVRSICESASGDLFVAGQAGSHGIVVKFSINGLAEWLRSYFEIWNIRDISDVTDGNIVIVGQSLQDHVHFALQKIDLQGDTLWTRNYGNAEGGECTAVTETADGGYLLAGWKSGEGLHDGLLIRVNADGDSLWSVSTQTPDRDRYVTVEQTSDGGYMAAGNRETPGVRTAYWLQKLAPDLALNDSPNGLPSMFRLYPSYPNPFNATTTISFDLPRESRVLLNVFDLTGRSVATLADEVMAAGTHQARFDAGALPSGVYVYRLQTAGFSQSHKLVVLK